ncbi:MAG: hypothetical protein ACJ8J0_16200 [Longimicrobiaceae bacterium]
MLAGDRVAVGYVADQGQGGSPGPIAAVCLDSGGRELWSARDFMPEAALPDGSLVGLDAAGRMRILDGAGRPRPIPRDFSGLRVKGITGTGSHLHLETEAELLIADRELTITGRVVIPPMDPRSFRAFTGDGFAWVESGTLMISDAAGAARAVCTVPVELAEEAMDRFEEETGEPALGGWATVDVSIDALREDPSRFVDAIRDPRRQERLDRGDRLGEYLWNPGVDREEGVVFLANVQPPHLVMCVGLDGAPRWCICLSSGCCGSAPVSLPNGAYVVSSGCGGILSWITATGYVLHRTDPPVATDLSGAFDSRFHILPDSSCIASRGDDVVAHGPDARLLSTLPHAGAHFAYDERRDVLFTSAWTEDHNRTQCIEVRAFADFLPSRSQGAR